MGRVEIVPVFNVVKASAPQRQTLTRIYVVQWLG